jgi:hypothetical protein
VHTCIVFLSSLGLNVFDDNKTESNLPKYVVARGRSFSYRVSEKRFFKTTYLMYLRTYICMHWLHLFCWSTAISVTKATDFDLSKNRPKRDTFHKIVGTLEGIKFEAVIWLGHLLTVVVGNHPKDKKWAHFRYILLKDCCANFSELIFLFLWTGVGF